MPSSDRDHAAEWGRLMAEWDAALAVYTAAANRRTPGSGTDDDAVKAAGRELAIVKSRIDELLALAGADRKPPSSADDLVVVSLDPVDREQTDSIDDPAASRRRAADR